jgi:hypothetical protein
MPAKRARLGAKANSIMPDDAIFADWRFEQINTATTLPTADENYPLEWRFNTSETEYLDPRIFLRLEVKITNANGTAITNETVLVDDTDKPKVEDKFQKKEVTTRSNVGPINYLLMTMFKHVDIQVSMSGLYIHNM